MSNQNSLRFSSVWPSWLWKGEREPGIDLGGGRLLPPEDVLESHFRRLAAGASAASSAATAANNGAQDVRIEVAPNLKAAVRVMAPKLAPLADIAEELNTKLAAVEPAPQFRSDLHRALEEAHRQLAAQRAANPESPLYKSPLLWSLLVASTALISVMIAAAAWRQRHRTAG